METLVCLDCGTEWERERRRGAKPERCSECATLRRKSRKSVNSATYYQRHRDRVAKKNREYYEDNRDKMLERQREYYQENKERSRAWSYGRLYGISMEQYEEKAKAQDGKCAICGVQPDRLDVDHDHETGTVRDLLCRSCNLALGHMRDDSVRMYRAAEYLDRHTTTS
jgi:hypothetical protein